MLNSCTSSPRFQTGSELTNGKCTGVLLNADDGSDYIYLTSVKCLYPWGSTVTNFQKFNRQELMEAGK